MNNIDVKTQVLANTRISKNQSFQKTAQEGQQHYSDKLEKDHDKDKTSVNETEHAENQNVDKDGKNPTFKDAEHQKKEKKKKKKPVESKDPDRGNFIDIKT